MRKALCVQMLNSIQGFSLQLIMSFYEGSLIPVYGTDSAPFQYSHFEVH